MARLPSCGPVVVEPLAPAVAEEWVDVQDVEQAMAAGHRGEALLSVLGLLAGEHYRDAARSHPRTSSTVARNDVVSTRPQSGPTNEAVAAWRHWVLSGRCPFRDQHRFLDEVQAMRTTWA